MVVNYIREINAFMEFMMEEELSGNAQLLWHALMHIANTRGEGEEWPESIRISNRKLLLYLPYSEDTLAAAREELIQAGRIGYAAGNKKDRPEYTIFYFSTEKGELSTSSADSPANTPRIHPKFSGQSAEQSQNVNAYVYAGDDDDEEVARADAPAADDLNQLTDAECALCEAWRDSFGPGTLNGSTSVQLAGIAVQLNIQPAVLQEAVREAARMNARAPTAYIAALLDDWSREGVRTLSDLGELQVMRDIQRGKLMGCGMVTQEDLAKARERRLERGA